MASTVSKRAYANRFFTVADVLLVLFNIRLFGANPVICSWHRDCLISIAKAVVSTGGRCTAAGFGRCSRDNPGALAG